MLLLPLERDDLQRQNVLSTTIVLPTSEPTGAMQVSACW